MCLVLCVCHVSPDNASCHLLLRQHNLLVYFNYFAFYVIPISLIFFRVPNFFPVEPTGLLSFMILFIIDELVCWALVWCSSGLTFPTGHSLQPGEERWWCVPHLTLGTNYSGPRAGLWEEAGVQPSSLCHWWELCKSTCCHLVHHLFYYCNSATLNWKILISLHVVSHVITVLFTGYHKRTW